jgi:hypothetical protein
VLNKLAALSHKASSGDTLGASYQDAFGQYQQTQQQMQTLAPVYLVAMVVRAFSKPNAISTNDERKAICL